MKKARIKKKRRVKNRKKGGKVGKNGKRSDFRRENYNFGSKFSLILYFLKKSIENQVLY